MSDENHTRDCRGQVGTGAAAAASPDETWADLLLETTKPRVTEEELDALYLTGSHEAGIPPVAVRGLVDPPAELPIPFDLVPRLRRRRNGWTEAAQRGFIHALAMCGCVSRAARAVGMSAKSAYRLRDADGAESFAAAWDQATAYAVEELRWNAIDRATNGAWVEVVRRGKVARLEHRYNDRLAIALLSGRRLAAVEKREQAVSRRRYSRFLAERRAAAADKKQAADAVRAEHQAVLDRIEHERLNPRSRKARMPRVRLL